MIGSSMGGYLACRWTELHPERVSSLFLLCPAFNFIENTKQAIFGGEDMFRKWKKQGYLDVKDFVDKPVKLHWQFIEDAK
jgi:pimeloyl-ACP methyl ester carboxylesterase